MCFWCPGRNGWTLQASENCWMWSFHSRSPPLLKSRPSRPLRWEQPWTLDTVWKAEATARRERSWHWPKECPSNIRMSTQTFIVANHSKPKHVSAVLAFPWWFHTISRLDKCVLSIECVSLPKFPWKSHHLPSVERKSSKVTKSPMIGMLLFRSFQIILHFWFTMFIAFPIFSIPKSSKT